MFEAPADLAAILAVDLGLFLGLTAMAGLLDPLRAADRLLFGVTAGALIATYASWRWHDTLPRFELTAESLWPYLFFVFEAIAELYTLMSIFILLRTSDHSPEADRAEAALSAHGSWPAVDIFICTYNEPQDVIEKSIIPALNIDYPNYTVWVLDDTRRGWLKDYCEAVGARYLTRPDNTHAKAGNLNSGLRQTAALTNAPLILVLDADFAPHRNILRRMVGMFADPKVAVVQTPQFYYNPDPIQHNLLAIDSWVDDQRIFFDTFQPAKDAWGCAFCVGTSFIVRRDRLNEMGGFPDEAMSEDINLTYRLMARGYVTRWLNERLSVGLSAEGLPEYITQRTRWCLGTIQVALLKSGPILGPGYTPMQRFQYVHGIFNWLCKPFIVLMLIAPVLYWFGGLPAFHADYLSYLRYGAPALLALWFYSGWVSGNRTLPLFMEVTHTITALAVTITLASAVVRPFGRPFKVTTKGGDRSEMIVHWKMALPFAAVSLLSGGSIVWAFVSPDAASEVSALDTFNLVWAGVAMVLTFVAFLLCFERPRPRREERFRLDRPGSVRLATGVSACTLVDLSPSGAKIELASNAPSPSVGDRLDVHVGGVGWLRAEVKRQAAGRRGVAAFGLAFALEPAERRALIEHLFAAPIENVAPTARLGGALLGLARRSLNPT